jgi:hypothetical protein
MRLDIQLIVGHNVSLTSALIQWRLSFLHSLGRAEETAEGFSEHIKFRSVLPLYMSVQVNTNLLN